MIEIRFFFYEMLERGTVPITAEGAKEFRESWGKPHYTTRFLPTIPRIGEWVDFLEWGRFRVKDVIHTISDEEESFSVDVYLDSGSYHE